MAVISLHIALNEAGRRVGDSHHRAKLSNGEVDLIHELYSQGFSYRDLALKFEVSKSTIRSIITGRCRAQFPSSWRVIKTGEPE